MVVSIVALGIIVGIFAGGIIVDLHKTNRIVAEINKIWKEES